MSLSTVYNQWTVFPWYFDPVAAGITLAPSAAGDLDGADGLTASDVDLLVRRIGDAGFMSWQFAMFDLNGDLAINDQDQRTWVVDLKQTWFGDADLDGEFNSDDFVQAFQAGKYETQRVRRLGRRRLER